MADTTPQNDTRAAVEAAMQQHESAGEVAAPMSAIDSTPEEAPAQEKPAAPERVRDEAGKFAQKPKEKPAEGSGKAPPAGGTEEKPDQPAGDEKSPEQPQRAAPPKGAPLPPALREQWGALPEVAREYILKREGEVSRVLSQTAEARKTHEALAKTLEPYREMLTGEPMTVVGGLLQTAAVLHRGSPQDKAALAAQMIQGYGIDIETLANALEGGAAGPQAPQHFRDPRVDAIEQRLAREEQQRMQQARQSAAVEYREFAENAEFLDSPGVREAMEREMRHEAARGVVLGLKDAYDRVVWALKDTRDVLLERERKAPTGTATSQAAIQKAKNAGSSVKTEPSMARVTTDNSIEALIRAQLEGVR
jgi:hypothetical protein